MKFFLLAFLLWILHGCGPKPPLVPVEQLSFNIPKHWSEEPVICLLDSESIEFLPDKESNRLRATNTTVYWIQKRNPPLLLELDFYDYPSVEQQPEIEIELYYPDGHCESVAKYLTERKNIEPRGHYSSDLWKQSVQLPSYQQGMRITVREKRVSRWVAMETHSYLRTEYPTVKRRIHFHSPDAEAVKVGLKNTEGLQIQTQRVDTGFLKLDVSGNNLEKIEFRNAPSKLEEWYAGVHFTLPTEGNSVPGWKAVGEQYLLKIDSNLKAGKIIRAMAAQLPDGNPEAIMQAAFALVVGKIRYLANEEKMYGWIPRSPDYVLENGVGDCKEMSNVLRALLLEKKLDAGLALVYSGQGFQVENEYPGLGNFNHCIAYVRLADGTLHFLDPTVTFSDAANSYSHLAGKKSLILSQGSSRLVEIPLSQGQITRISTRTEFSDLKSDGSWFIRGQAEFTGLLSFRWTMRTRYGDPAEVRAWMQKELKDVFGLEAQHYGVESVSPERIHLSFQGRVNGKSMQLGKTGILLDAPIPYSSMPASLMHEGPIEFLGVEQRDEWVLPEGFKKSESSPMDYPGVQGDWAQNGNTITRQFRATRMQFKAGDTTSLKLFKKQLKRFSSAMAWKS